MKKTATLVLAATALAAATPALASDAQIHISAYVPVRCQMDFSGQVSMVAATSFRLGTLQRFCNTRYEMTLSYAGAPAGAQFQYDGHLVAAGAQSTTVATLAPPVNGNAQLVAHNLDFAAASEIGSSLVVQVTPIPF